MALRHTYSLLTAVLMTGGCLLRPSDSVPQQPITVGQLLPDFTLAALQGGEVTLSSLRGKTVVLVFPRGRSGSGWCHVCHYQYAELAEFDEQRGLRENHDVEILFVLPYASGTVQQWADAFPAQLQDIEDWKNPPDQANLDERQQQRMEIARRYYPKQLRYEAGSVPLPFPILIDADRAISQRLGLFTTNWGGAEAEQNVPTIFILDGDGVVQFKYYSQNTLDRPGPEYLLRVVENLVRND